MQKALSAKRKNDAVLRVRHDKPSHKVNILGANHAAERLLGYNENELQERDLTYITPDRIDVHINDFLNEEDSQDLASVLRKVLHFEIETKEKQIFPASLKVFPLVVEDLNTPEYELLMRDVTLLKKLEELREYLNKELSSVDALTGVRNSDAVFGALDVIHEHIQTDRNVEASFVFIYIDDIDTIRDRYGTQHADRLLKHVAQLLNSTVREGDVVGHVGDNVLSMLLLDCNSTDARAVFKRVNGKLRNNPFVLGKNSKGDVVDLIPTLSVGYKQVQATDASIERISELVMDALERSINAGGNYISEA